jgi:hypothetical protein
LGGIGSFFGLGGGGAAAKTPQVAQKQQAALDKLMGGVQKAAMLFKALIVPAALAGTVALFRKLTFGLSESNRDLSKWNGALAMSFAKMDIQQMRLDIRQAKATQGTAVGLNDALMEVKQEFQPIREDLGILINLVGISAAKLLKAGIEGVKLMGANFPLLKELVDAAKAIEDGMKKDIQGGGPGAQVLAAVARGEFQEGGGGPAPRQLPRPPQAGDIALLPDMRRARGAFLNPDPQFIRGRRRRP